MLENRDLKKFRIRKLFTQYHAFYAVHFFFSFFQVLPRQFSACKRVILSTLLQVRFELLPDIV